MICSGEIMSFVVSNKNRLAVDVINNLIAHCCWMNIHTVAPHRVVFETRVADGYDACWTEDGSKVCGYTKFWYLYVQILSLDIYILDFQESISI